MKHAFTFDHDHDTGAVVPEVIGKLVLHGEHQVRIAFTPEGLELYIPETARDAVHFFVIPKPGVST